MNDSTLELIIKAKNQASKELNDVKKSSDDLDRAWSGLKSGAKTAGIAAIAATAAVVGFGVSSVKSFAESESAIAQTNAVLKSTKGVAGVTAEQIDKLASSLQRTTKYSDEQVRSGQNMLLTFTKIGKDTFPQATETMLDMSTALGQDLQSSAIQLGKALQDPIRGVTALRRVGVNFSEEQQKQIKNFVDTNRLAEAQALILKELQTEFGGSAKAAGETFAGKLAILKNQFDEVKESIGGVLVTALTPLMQRLAEFVASDKFQVWLARTQEWLSKNLPIAINYLVNELIPQLANIFQTVWPAIQQVLIWLGNLIKFLSNNEWVIWATIGAFAALKAALAIQGAVNIYLAAMAVLRGSNAATATSARQTATAIGLIRSALLLVARNWQITLAIIGVAAVIAALDQIRNAISRVTREWENLKARDVPLKNTNMKVSGGSGTGLVQQLRNMFSGRAIGGPVSMGKTYMVGEEGPELFTPKNNGSIIPNDKLGSGGGSTEVNYNGPIYLQTADAVREFFDVQSSNKRFVNKGIAPIRG